METTLAFTRFAFGSLGAVLPEPMAALAEKLYFSPRRHRQPERERSFLSDAKPLAFETPAGTLAGWRWQPWFPWERKLRGTVLLVHGWEGRAAQLGSLIEPLLAEGYAVVAADAPGHGRSPGDTIDLPTYAACLRAVADAIGDVRGVVAHSFGCAATILALEDGLPAEAVVLLSPPTSLLRFADEFSRVVGLTKATEAIFKARLEERFGREWWRTYALDEKARALGSVKALVVHDAEDREVPVGEGRALARAWPGAELVVTQGLGHRRLLKDEGVVRRAAAFIAG